MIVKATGDRYPIQQILLFRFGLSLLPLLVIGLVFQRPLVLTTRRLKDHCIRTSMGITSVGLFFVSVNLIPLATATALSYAAPIFCAVLSIPLLGEAVGYRRWCAIVVGFIGVLVISWPGSEIVNSGSIAAIGSAISGAIVVLYLRKLSDTEAALTSSLFYNFTGAVVAGLWCATSGWVAISESHLWWLLALGLLAGVQQFSFANAFRYAEATLLAPLDYLVLILAVIAGYLFWGEVPSTSTWIGGIIIMSAGIFMIHRRPLAQTSTNQL